MSIENIKEVESKRFKILKNLDTESLMELLEVAKTLQAAMANNNQEKIQELSGSIPLLNILLEYFLVNIDNSSIEPSLLEFLKQLLYGKNKEKPKEESLQEKEENRLAQEEKDRKYRLAIYELYKILNPNRLAGESSLENWLNNVRTRGIEVARGYDGKEFEKNFHIDDMKNLESHKFSFNALLKEAGAKGKGRGL